VRVSEDLVTRAGGRIGVLNGTEKGVCLAAGRGSKPREDHNTTGSARCQE